MIKPADEGKDITISVYLKNGEEYLYKDITSDPFGNREAMVGFYHNDKFRIYPISEVLMIEYNFTSEE